MSGPEIFSGRLCDQETVVACQLLRQRGRYFIAIGIRLCPTSNPDFFGFGNFHARTRVPPLEERFVDFGMEYHSKRIANVPRKNAG